MNRLASFLCLAGCATTAASSSPSPSEAPPAKIAEPQKLAITNVIPFDIAACGPRPLTLTPMSAEVLTGAMLSMTPATQECFVDLQARDGQTFDLKAKAIVAESGVTFEVSGLGASASGKACVEAALKKLPLVALAAGSKPVSTEIPIRGGPQTVKVGDNAANDIAGKLRLAQPSMCECYAKLAGKPVPMLKAEIEVAAEGTAKVNLGAADELTACLTTRMQALPLGNVATRMTWPLLLKNTYSDQVDASAPAALRFQQLDGMRAQRTSDILIATGQRDSAALAFDALAQSYKKKPAKGMLEELKVKCADVAAGDDKQLAAVKRLVAVLEDSQSLVLAEKVKDPQWAQVEPMLAQALTSSTAEVVRIEGQKKNDLNACPKTKF